jgi:hypothetical protein
MRRLYQTVTAVVGRQLSLSVPPSVVGLSDVPRGIELVRSNQHVEAASIAAAHSLFEAVKEADALDHPTVDFRSVVAVHDASARSAARLLLRRDFWSYSDYCQNDSFLTVGPQYALFDNYKWTVELADKFRLYMEEYFPLRDHTHLEYITYVRAMKHFRWQLLGRSFRPVLPPWMKLRPRLGVPVPTQSDLAPYKLYETWLRQFVRPLGIQRALVEHATCGIVAFATRANVSVVTARDPSPNAVLSMQADQKRYLPRLNRMSIEVGAASDVTTKKFDLVTCCALHPAVIDVDSGSVDYKYAPAFAGLRGRMEEALETASEKLHPGGVLAVLCTNVHSLAEPGQPHPIEHEIRANRRWVLLDFYDAPLPSSAMDDELISAKISMPLRAELWVLHKLDDLAAFGWVHGVPGSKPPPSVSVSQQKKRLAGIKERAIAQGYDWNEYKDRLLQVMKSSPDNEDDVAQAIRAKLDPTYAGEVAEKTRRLVLAKLKKEAESFKRIGEMETSPRDTYNAEYRAASPPPRLASRSGRAGRKHKATRAQTSL